MWAQHLFCYSSRWKLCLQACRLLETLYSSRTLQPSDLNAEARSALCSLPAELQMQVRCQQCPCSCLHGLHSQTCRVVCFTSHKEFGVLTSQASLMLVEPGPGRVWTPAVPRAAGAAPAVVSSVTDLRSSFAADDSRRN